MITLLLIMLAQGPTPKVICTSVGGPFVIGATTTTIGTKCCPPGSFIADPSHPTDKNGNLICYREET